MIKSYSWDEYFMTLAYLVSMKSKDPSTRVGAVIVGKDNEIISTGYNGLPRNVEDKIDRYVNKDYKYLSSNHAEENAILHCARNGVSSKNCSIYTPWIPCSRCAKSIIQAGISEVIYDENFPGNDVNNQNEVWKQSIEVSNEILLEAKVKIRKFNGKLIKIKGLYQEEEFDLI
ncbi:deoxycytidylate deaminase [Rickettsiales endosymbiont of Trichoplax sp. H2]|uniref:deoxycytidylate deaminase n=1 Tax=Rickettsiales endosymbiont of Trichoplax sp. H2 TaxID=2021221 RepID=UPI0012B1975C|nr:dCMP deaminase family protein [Rickettsiales endosymbiont of Trichoplax sp. H2]MSO14357.1 Deoxycytidylate deaminase [Rickettsiales endosymbiont of Trichoplax sp. H2]